MAQRRMFSKEVTESDWFVEMPLSTQALYFHLGMSADDDGFVSPQRVMRSINASKNDLDLLIGKGFCIPFENSIIVLTHRKVNNEIKSDRKKATIYQEHLSVLGLENKLYKPMSPECLQNVSVGKDRLEENRIGENSIDNNISVQQSGTSDEIICTDVDAISIPVEGQRPMKVKKTKPKIEYPQDIEELYQTIKKTSGVIVDSKEHAMIELQEKLKTTSAEKILELSRITGRAIKVGILDAQYIKRMGRWVRDLDTEGELQENSVIKYILDKAIAITVHHKKRGTEASKKWTMKDDIAPLLIGGLDENGILNNALRLYYRKGTDSLMDNPNIK